MRTRSRWAVRRLPAWAGVMCACIGASAAHAQRLNLGGGGPPTLAERSVLVARADEVRNELAQLRARLDQARDAGVGRDALLALEAPVAARELALALLDRGRDDAPLALLALTLVDGLDAIDALGASHAEGAKEARAGSSGGAAMLRWARGRESLDGFVARARDAALLLGTDDTGGAVAQTRLASDHLYEAAWAAQGLAPPGVPPVTEARLRDIDLDQLRDELRSIGLGPGAIETLATLTPQVARADALLGAGADDGRPSMILRDVLGLIATLGRAPWIDDTLRKAVVQHVDEALASPDGDLWGEARAVATVGRTLALIEALDLEDGRRSDAEALGRAMLARLLERGGRGRLAAKARVVDRALGVMYERQSIPDWRTAPGNLRTTMRAIALDVDALGAGVLSELVGVVESDSAAVSPSSVSLLVRHADAVEAYRRVVEVDDLVRELGAMGDESARALAQRVGALKPLIANEDDRTEAVEELVVIGRAFDTYRELTGERLLAMGGADVDAILGGRSAEVARIVRKDRAALFTALAQQRDDTEARAALDRDAALLGAIADAVRLRDEALLARLDLSPWIEGAGEAGEGVRELGGASLGQAVDALIADEPAGMASAIATHQRASSMARLLVRLGEAAGAEPVADGPAAGQVAAQLGATPAWWTPTGGAVDELANVSRWMCELGHARAVGDRAASAEIMTYLNARAERVLFELDSARGAGDGPVVRPTLPRGVDEMMP